MIQTSDVLTELMNYADIEGYSESQLCPSCERGLLWVQNKLREGVDEDNVLITHTAAALAHFFFFLCRLAEPDKYATYKAGDMSVSRNIEKEFEFEKNLRKEAIAAASEILKDGGFCFLGT